MAGCFQHDNEHSGSRRCREYLDHLRDCHLLRKNYALWNWQRKVVVEAGRQLPKTSSSAFPFVFNICYFDTVM
jgi:hypothetical protein